jgi:hypothetical protein
MFSSLLAAYTVIALLVALYTIVRMAIAGPQQGVDHDPLDRGILLLTALAASAAWGVLLPVFLSGWIASPPVRRGWERLGRIPLRPVPVLRVRLPRAIR